MKASITPRLVNPLGEKTLIKLAGITETAAHMQKACSIDKRSSMPAVRVGRRIRVGASFATLAHVRVRLHVYA